MVELEPTWNSPAEGPEEASAWGKCRYRPYNQLFDDAYESRKFVVGANPNRFVQEIVWTFHIHSVRRSRTAEWRWTWTLETLSAWHQWTEICIREIGFVCKPFNAFSARAVNLCLVRVMIMFHKCPWWALWKDSMSYKLWDLNLIGYVIHCHIQVMAS